MGIRERSQKPVFFLLLGVLSPSFLLANTKTTREALLETLYHTPNPPMDCRNILHVEESAAGERAFSLDFTGIEQKIFTHHQAKASENRFPNELFMQYAKGVLGASREYLQEVTRRLTELWTSAQGEEINAAVKNAQAKRTVDPHAHDGRFRRDYFYSIPYSKEEFPSLASLVDHPERFTDLSPSTQVFVLNGEVPVLPKAKKGKKLPTEELEQYLSGKLKGRTYPASLSKDLENRVRSDLIEADYRRFKAALRELSTRSMENIEQELRDPVIGENGKISRWDDYMKQDGLAIARPYFIQNENLIKAYLHQLQKKFPISGANKKNAEIQRLLQMIEAMDGTNAPYSLVGPVFDAEKKSFHFRERDVIVRYNPRLATNEVLSARGEISGGPVLLAIHGAGTTRSSGASFSSLISFAAANRLNMLAMDSTDAGSGIMVSGHPLLTVTNTELVLRETKERLSKPDENGVETPLLLLGRSIGSTNAIFTDLFFPDTVADGILTMSFSNPWTLRPQIKNVDRQVAEGSVPGAIEGALQDAITFAEGNQDLLQRAYDANKHVFKTFGNKAVFFQGDADEDAKVVEKDQPEVLNGLYTWRNKFMPAAHVVPFHSPFKDDPRFTTKIAEVMEATHFLLTASEDLNREELLRKVDSLFQETDQMTASQREENRKIHAGARALFEEAPEELLPKLRTQSEVLFAHSFAYLDYMANGLPNGLEWPDPNDRATQLRLRRYRDKVAGQGKTLFEHYIEHLNKSDGWTEQGIHLSLDEIKNTLPGRKSKAAWFASVYRFWFEREPDRVLQLYRKHGSIP